MPVQESFTKHFDEVERTGPARFGALRRQARSRRFLELPFPTPRTEDWRFTSVTPIVQTAFEPAGPDVAVDPALVPPLTDPGAIRLAFVNGWFAPRLSNIPRLPGGVAVGSLGSAAPEQARSLAQVADASDQVFTALNTALLHDGAFLVVPDGKTLPQPIEVLYIASAGGKKVALQPRTLIVVGRDSQATLVERFATAGGEGTYFTNAVTEIALAENGRFDHYKVQQEAMQAYHVANTQAVLGRSANFSTHYIALGGGLVRNEVRVRFDGPGAEATVNGLYLGAGKQHLDNFTVIDHAQPHCASHELYKGILSDQAHGVFNGKIFVRKDAQKTDAKQTNKVLLLSDGATIDTKPQLEIFADDVKCTHGATVGQLDADQVFYLQTRGLPAEQARRLLTYAFANDIIGRIKIDSIRAELESALFARSF